MSGASLKDQFPLRLIIGREDCTQLLDDQFSFSSVDPGGYEAASFNIPKDMPETLRGTYVRLDSGLNVAFEGRVSQIQRSLGNKTAVTCEGYGALFKDEAASMIFIDQDLTQWQGASTQRQINDVNAGYSSGSSDIGAANDGNGVPALALTASGSWAAGAVPSIEAWYDAGPENTIAAIDFAAEWTQWSDGTIMFPAFFISSDLLASSIDAATINGGPSSGANSELGNMTVNATSAKRYAGCWIQGTAGSAGGIDNQQYTLFYENVAVYGSNEIPFIGGYPRQYYPSSIAQWVIARVPGLVNGVIPLTDATGYTIPQSVYYTPVTLDQMIGDMATAAGWHWGVWESQAALTGNPTPRCDFRPRPPTGIYTGFCLRRDTTDCDVREDLSQQYNACVVTFSLADGTNGAVTVQIDNPILDQAGIASRTLVLSGGTMTPQTAALFGQMALQYTYNEARVAGSVEIDQPIRGLSGLIAPWQLKPGIDRLRVGDLPSTDAWGAYNDLPLQRMEASCSSSGFSASLEVGWGASMVDTLQARLAAATALAAVGA